MRKYKQVQRKEVVYSLDEWKMIEERSDFEYLKSVVTDTEQKAAPLKENFEKCSRLYDIYSEISKTYYEISQGDYISRLVNERRQADDKEQEKSERKNQR